MTDFALLIFFSPPSQTLLSRVLMRPDTKPRSQSADLGDTAISNIDGHDGLAYSPRGIVLRRESPASGNSTIGRHATPTVVAGFSCVGRVEIISLRTHHVPIRPRLWPLDPQSRRPSTSSVVEVSNSLLSRRPSVAAATTRYRLCMRRAHPHRSVLKA